jgi:cyclase
MKSIRLISRLDIKGPNVVKGVHTEGLRVVGNPKELALKYYKDGADEIVYMDIVASLYERNLDFDQLRSVCDNIFIPFTVGGGIRSIRDINDALRAGADKVAINTYAIHHPDFLTEAARNFGSQCVVLSIEAKRIGDGKWEAYTEGGRERTNVDAVEWAKKAIELGVGEIILTSIDQDGTQKGYDIDLIKKVAEFASVPVVAHGGAGSPKDIIQVIKEGKADAVSASSIYHYDIFTISDVKKELGINHLPVRSI